MVAGVSVCPLILFGSLEENLSNFWANTVDCSDLHGISVVLAMLWMLPDSWR